MDTGKIFLGVLAGLATGAVLGILFAPDKGSETRKKIASKAGELTDSVKGKFNEFVDGASEKYNAAKEGVSDFAEHMKSKSDGVEKEAKKV